MFRSLLVVMGLLLMAVLAACSQPGPPTPTPTPSPTPIPPASYRIAYDGLRYIDAGDGLVQTEFLLSVTNTGKVDGVDIPVQVEGGGDVLDAAPIALLRAGVRPPSPSSTPCHRASTRCCLA